MKIKLKPIELEVQEEDANDYLVNTGLSGELGEAWIPKTWAEPVPEPIKPGTPCMFWDDDPIPERPALGFYASHSWVYGTHKDNAGKRWKHARKVTPADLRRWAGEEADDE